MPIDIGAGILHEELQEISIPGKFTLTWTRNYSTAVLEQPATPLGRGWANQYFCKLAYQDEAYHFWTPTGTLETFPDADQRVERGELLINFGAFHALQLRDDKYVVRHWDVETGNVTHYVFLRDRLGAVCPMQAIEDPTGQGLDLEYDWQSRLIAIRQRLEGRQLMLAYDQAGWINEVVFRAPSGETSIVARYHHDGSGCLITAADVAGLEDYYEYDPRGHMRREITKDGGVFSARYDTKGRCVYLSGLDRYDEKRLKFLDATGFVEVTDSVDAVWRYRCLPSGQVVEEINPLGAIKRTAYDEAGRVIAITDEMGGTATCSYDPVGNRESVTNALGQVFRLTYNAARLQLSMTDPMGGVWTRHYNNANRLVATEDPVGAIWRYTYDDDGNLVSVRNPAGATKTLSFMRGALVAGTDWLGHVSQYRLDHFGRLIEKTDPLGGVTRIRYDRWGNLTEHQAPDGSVRRAEFDAVGNLLRYMDADGSVMRFVYGPCRLLQQRIESDGSSTQYRWSTEPDRLVEILNERGESYRIMRDEAGNIIEEIGFDGRSTQYAYDAAGRCIAEINGNGEKVLFHRDQLGNLTGRVLPDGQATTFEFDALGNMASASNAHIQLVFERDPVGRLIREVQGEHWVRSHYNAAGHLLRTETSTGHKVDYVVDGNGDVTQIACASQMIRMTRDARGLETRRAVSTDTFLDFKYDAVGRLLEQLLFVSGTHHAMPLPSASETLFFRTYAYEATSIATAVSDSHWGSKSYVYDRAQRLLARRSNGNLTEGFEYDVTGNLVQIRRAGANQSAEALVYTAGNRLERKASTVYRFDTQGRLVCKEQGSGPAPLQHWEYHWNAADQLVSLSTPHGETWSYVYDPLGRRITKGRNGTIETRFVWDRDCLIHELETGSSTSWICERDNLAPVAHVDQRGMTAVICDHIGTPIAFAHGYRAVTRTQELTAWGQGAGTPRNTEPCNLRFQGQYFDAESGLHYSQFRYYDPETGRFISQDPIGINGGFNCYAYAINPINFIDPYGLSTSSDSQQLGDNLIAQGQSPIGDNEDAHHIVMSNSTNAKMQDLRTVMDGHGIDKNDPRNGIWLPRTTGDRESGDTRTAHKGEGLHGDAYKQYVYDKLMAGAPPPPSKREFLARLRQLKNELAQGKKFPCKR